MASAALYFGLALLLLLSLIWWQDYTGRVLSGPVVGVVGFLASTCAFFGFAILKARKGSPLWIKIFALGGGLFFGNVAGFGGWKAALVFGVPFVVGLFGLWRRQKVLANPAFESGPPSAAAQRER